MISAFPSGAGDGHLPDEQIKQLHVTLFYLIVGIVSKAKCTNPRGNEHNLFNALPSHIDLHGFYNNFHNPKPGDYVIETLFSKLSPRLPSYRKDHS